VDEMDELFNRRIPPRKFHTIDLGSDRSATFTSKVISFLKMAVNQEWQMRAGEDSSLFGRSPQ